MLDFTFIQVPNKLVNPVMYPFSLSLLYLAASLEKEGAKVGVADLRDKKLEDKGILDCIPRAKVYGFTATTPEIGSAKILAKRLKERDPASITIVGGAHASVLPKDCEKDFDIVATGEWESAIVKLFKNGHTGGIVHAGLIPKLDALPFPARHLAGERAFSNTLMPGHMWGEGERAAMTLSSRGCPITPPCSFCANLAKSPVRFRSPENVVAEIAELKVRYNCHAFRDEADNITANKRWLLKYCQLLAPLKVHWKGHSRAEWIDEDMVIALKESGMVEMGMGLESADPVVLELANKKEKIEDFQRAIALLKKHGIISKVYFIANLPGETELTLELNAQFMREVKPDKSTISRFTPFPGSAIWQNPSRYGAIIQKDSFEGYWLYTEHAVIEYEGVSRETLDSRFRRMLAYLESNEWRQA